MKHSSSVSLAPFMMLLFLLLLLSPPPQQNAVVAFNAAATTTSKARMATTTTTVTVLKASPAIEGSSNTAAAAASTRRGFLTAGSLSALLPQLVAVAAVTTAAVPSAASATTGAGDGNLPDLPPDAVRSYLQYRVQFQIALDAYVFELQSKIGDVDQWGDIGQLFRVNNNKGQGSPSRIERDYTNTMRVLLLSMPPDLSEDMRDAQFRFEKAMSAVSKATSGYRRDLPVEIPKSSVENAAKGFEDGRVALNDFVGLLNKVTGLNEIKQIPPEGPNQRSQYGRSYLKYNELVKKTKLCQNRGGPALSQGWGLLMVSGYMQDSCGIPDLEKYFYQA